MGLLRCRRPVVWMRRAMEQGSSVVRNFVRAEMLVIRGGVNGWVVMAGGVGRWVMVSGWGVGAQEGKELGYCVDQETTQFGTCLPTFPHPPRPTNPPTSGTVYQSYQP